jgi:hypothetical protein
LIALRATGRAGQSFLPSPQCFHKRAVVA